MRILVTGGAGFIGSHLCDCLVREGHRIAIVDDLSLGRRENIAHLLGRSDVVFHELSVHESGFDGVVRDGGFECVFHMAANSDIQAGSRDRRADLEKTLPTTWAVLEAMARHRVGQLIFASTSAIYGETAELIGEDFGPLVPVSFYGAAKLAGEAYVSAYAHRHDIRSWVFRFPNVVGSRATHGVILDFVVRLKEHPEILHVRGAGSQMKP